MSKADDTKFTLNEFKQAFEVIEQNNLNSLLPEEGIDRYLSRKEDDLDADSTKGEYRRKLGFFEEYCEKRGIETLDELDSESVDGYYKWRRDESSDQVDRLSPTTLSDDMYLIRDFLTYLENIEAVEDGLSDAIKIPDVDDDDEHREDKLNSTRARNILKYLRKFCWADLWHVMILLLTETGRRRGDLYALDCEDVQTDADPPYVKFRNRDDQGTRLKNGDDSEEKVYLSEQACEVIEDYLAHQRPDVTDRYGRRPLLASEDGRLAKPTIKKYCYMLTRPCFIDQECPHGRDPDTCKAAQKNYRAFECPSSKATHAVRKGYITEMRNQHVPKTVLSDRCDVSPEILEKHYDEGDEEERLQRRTEILRTLERDGDGGYTGKNV